MKPIILVSLVALLALGSAGCASSQMSRIDRNRDLYDSWPIDIRQAILDGLVEPGMTPEMVRVAWGEPAEIVQQARSGDEIWVYKKGGHDGSMMYPGGYPSGYPGGYPSGYPGGVVGGPGIGISTGRGGTSVGATGGVGIGMGGTGVIGPAGGAPIMTRPSPPDIREVVFRNGIVHRADKP
jgi:hypothetical protein